MVAKRALEHLTFLQCVKATGAREQASWLTGVWWVLSPWLPCGHISQWSSGGFSERKLGEA